MDQNTPVAPQTTPQSQPSFRGLEGPVELISRAYRLFIRHWQPLVAISALPALLSGGGSLLMSLKSPIPVTLGIIAVIAGMIASIAMVAAIIDAVRRIDADDNANISFSGQYAFGFSYFWPVVWVSIIAIFVHIGAGILFIIPAVIMAVYTAVYSYALVVGGKRGLSALEESYALVRGRWWGVLGRMLFLTLVFLAVWLVSSGVVFLASGMQTDSVVSEWATAIIQIIINLIMGPIAVAFSYRLYKSLEDTRDRSVSTAAFRTWSMAFIVVGIAVPVIAIVATLVSVLSH